MNAHTRRVAGYLFALVSILLGVIAGNAIDLDHLRRADQGGIQTPLGRMDWHNGRPYHIPALVHSFYSVIVAGTLYTGLWCAGIIGAAVAVFRFVRRRKANAIL